MNECPECKYGELIPLYRFASDCGHEATNHTTMADCETGFDVCLDTPVGESRCDRCGEHVSDGGAAWTTLEQHLAAHQWLQIWTTCSCREPHNQLADTMDEDEYRAHVADTWSEARTVRTVEQLDALPGQSIVAMQHDGASAPLQKLDDEWFHGNEAVDTEGLLAAGRVGVVVWTPEGGAA